MLLQNVQESDCFRLENLQKHATGICLPDVSAIQIHLQIPCYHLKRIVRYEGHRIQQKMHVFLTRYESCELENEVKIMSNLLILAPQQQKRSDNSSRPPTSPSKIRATGLTWSTWCFFQIKARYLSFYAI